MIVDTVVLVTMVLVVVPLPKILPQFVSLFVEPQRSLFSPWPSVARGSLEKSPWNFRREVSHMSAKNRSLWCFYRTKMASLVIDLSLGQWPTYGFLCCLGFFVCFKPVSPPCNSSLFRVISELSEKSILTPLRGMGAFYDLRFIIPRDCPIRPPTHLPLSWPTG